MTSLNLPEPLSGPAPIKAWKTAAITGTEYVIDGGTVPTV